MKLTIYHGSQFNIKKPQYGKGKPYNDYGLAFYCTEEIELAREWASTNLEHDGFVNIYEMDIDGLDVLHVAPPDYHVLNWLAILLDNRRFQTNGDVAIWGREYVLSHYLIDYKKYDVIQGYRADDSYFAFANAFVNNSMTVEKLAEAMKYGQLGEQVAIRSERAFERIRYMGAEMVNRFEYYPRRVKRDEQARKQYQDSKLSIFNGHFLADIAREEWRNDDERLRRMLSE